MVTEGWRCGNAIISHFIIDFQIRIQKIGLFFFMKKALNNFCIILYYLHYTTFNEYEIHK